MVLRGTHPKADGLVLGPSGSLQASMQLFSFLFFFFNLSLLDLFRISTPCGLPHVRSSWWFPHRSSSDPFCQNQDPMVDLCWNGKSAPDSYHPFIMKLVLLRRLWPTLKEFSVIAPLWYLRKSGKKKDFIVGDWERQSCFQSTTRSGLIVKVNLVAWWECLLTSLVQSNCSTWITILQLDLAKNSLCMEQKI